MREDFKGRMKRLRLRAGFTSQGKAAEAIGCTRGTVSMWEAASSSVQSVEQYLLGVARAYKVRPDYINSGVGDDGYPWPPERVVEPQTDEGASPDPAQLEPASQPARLDIATVQRTAKGLRLAYSYEGREAPADLENADDAEDFVRAYQRALEIESSEESSAAITADVIRAWGARGDGKRGSNKSVGLDPDGPDQARENK